MNISKELYQEELERMGLELRRARIERGMTMKEAGRLIGVQESTVSKIETGQWNAGAAFFIAFAKIYNLEWTLTKKEAR